MRRRRLPWLGLVLVLGVAVARPGPGEPGAGARPDETETAEKQAEMPDRGEEQGAYGRTPADLVPYHKSAAPYRRFFTTPLVYRGPGRDKPVPTGLETVRIGLIAPLEGTDDDRAGRSLKEGVELALEEANASGGHRGLPFELVPKNDQAVWGASSNTLVELAYGDGVWAIIGSIDSNSTHVALRAALKAEVLIVNVGSSDPTVTETGIPWLVRCTPDDRQTGYRLARLLFQEMGFSRVAVLRSSDRYGRFGIKEFRDAARRMARPLPMEVLFAPDRGDFEVHLDRLEEAGAEAVVIWAKATAAGRILRQLRERGMTQPVVGPDRLVSPEFLGLAGEAAEGVVATAWMDPTRKDEPWLAFRRRFAERFDREPDVFAAYGYDAARMVIEAVREVDLNRTRIRDALMGLRRYEGVSGTMQFDATSNNVAPLALARVEKGRFVFH